VIGRNRSSTIYVDVPPSSWMYQPTRLHSWMIWKPQAVATTRMSLHWCTWCVASSHFIIAGLNIKNLSSDSFSFSMYLCGSFIFFNFSFRYLDRPVVCFTRSATPRSREARFGRLLDKGFLLQCCHLHFFLERSRKFYSCLKEQEDDGVRLLRPNHDYKSNASEHN